MNDRAAKPGKRKPRTSTPAGAGKPGAPVSNEAKAAPPLIDILPGLVLVSANYAFFLYAWQRHFHLLAGGIGLSALLALPFASKLPFSKELLTNAANDVARVYTKRGVWFALGALFILQLVASPFVESVHINGPADLKSRFALYRIAEDGGDAIVVDSAFMDTPKAHVDFVYLTRPGRSTWVQTSTSFHTRPFRSRFVSIDSATYPTSFDTVVSVAILPAPDLLTGMQDGQPLRLIVAKEFPRSVTLVDTTFTSVASFILSQAEPPKPDSVTRRRWLTLLQKELQAAESEVAPLADDFVNRSRWMKVRRPLSRREHLRAVVLNSAGDTLAVDTFTIVSPLHDAFTTRR